MRSSEHVRRRFRVESLDAAEAGVLSVSGGPLRHLKVLRAAPGDTVFVFDGRGREVEAEVVELGRDIARLAFRGEVESEVESSLRCCLVQAVPTRRARMDTIVRQVTELGVHRIVPVFAERSRQHKGQGDGAAGKVERWRRIADAAAEQCHRREVPLIDPPRVFGDLPWDSLPKLILIADPGAPLDPGDEAARLAAQGIASPSRPAEACVMIGPEGGWSDSEREEAGSHGARAIGLGPRVLRADTAGVVALALLQHCWGDLRSDTR